jgi:hypothetical protein
MSEFLEGAQNLERDALLMYRCLRDALMRYLLPLTLAAVAALSATGCAGPNLQGYAIMRASDPSAVDASCRLLADPRDNVRSFCASPAQWERYDKWAASAGVTCNKIPGQSQDACLTTGLWGRLAYSRMAPAGYDWSRANPEPSRVGVRFTGEIQYPTAGSYGPFPSGGAIGQTFQ